MKGGTSEILCGFKVLGGKLNVGTEIICYNINKKETIVLGKVIKMEKNHKEVSECKKNDEVCIKIDNPNGLIYQRHWSEADNYFSNITRSGVEILKRDFRPELTKDDWILTAKIAKLLSI